MSQHWCQTDPRELNKTFVCLQEQIFYTLSDILPFGNTKTIVLISQFDCFFKMSSAKRCMKFDIIICSNWRCYTLQGFYYSQYNTCINFAFFETNKLEDI